jgi:hypothetical protein
MSEYDKHRVDFKYHAKLEAKSKKRKEQAALNAKSSRKNPLD